MSGSTSTQIRDTQIDPPWLSGPNGQRFMYTLRLAVDVLLEKMNQAMRAHIPGQGTIDALPYLGSDREIIQGPAEPNTAYAMRLSQAFQAWGRAGSRWAILAQLQAFLQQTGGAQQLPLLAIVSQNGTYAIWDTIFTTTPSQAPPAHTRTLTNWGWDPLNRRWWAWLILYPPPAPTGNSGTAMTVSSQSGFYAGLGHNVSGVWVPNTGATAVNEFATLTGLANLTSADVQRYLVVSGAAAAGNNGTFQITQVLSSTSCVVANTAANTSDANNGAISWYVQSYPILPPSPCWGAPGYLWGDSTISWGVYEPAAYVQSIRGILETWKKADTYYVSMLVAYDGADGRAGSQFSPLSSPPAGNPDATWLGPGKNSAGVWVPSRVTISQFDAICDATGHYVQCSVQNVT